MADHGVLTPRTSNITPTHREPFDNKMKHNRTNGRKKLRQKNEDDFEDRWGDEEEEEEAFEESAAKRVRLSPQAVEPELSGEAKAALERDKDQEERDAFARRLQEREHGRSTSGKERQRSWRC